MAGRRPGRSARAQARAERREAELGRRLAAAWSPSQRVLVAAGYLAARVADLPPAQGEVVADEWTRRLITAGRRLGR